MDTSLRNKTPEAISRLKSGEYVAQVSAIGALGLEYLDPGNDPRQHSRHDALAPKPDRVRSRSDTRPTLESSG